MTARIVYNGLQKIFRYEMTQHGDIEEQFDPFKSDPANSKRDSDNDRQSEKKEETKEEIVHNSNDNLSKESLFMNRDNSTPINSESNKDLLLDEIKKVNKEIHTLGEKILNPLERIANFFEKYEHHFLSSHQSYNTAQAINENKDNKQSEVVWHQIEDYEKVRDKYPYEIFIRDELPNLETRSKKEYQTFYKLAEHKEPLAYFLYKNSLLSDQTMKSFLTAYKEYSNVHDEFDLKKLKSIYIEKDLLETDGKDTLAKKWKQWRQICAVSFGVSKDLFPQIKFSSKKKPKEQERSIVSKEIIKEAWDTLSKNGKQAESLMIYLMFAFELSPGDVRLLKFDDIKMKSKQATIIVHKLKSNCKQQIPISMSLYKRITKYQNDLTKNGKCYMSNRSTKTENIVGHFLFKDSKSLIIKKFRTKFGGILKDFDICPKDLRISSINDKISEESQRDIEAWEEQKTSKKVKETLRNESRDMRNAKKAKKIRDQ